MKAVFWLGIMVLTLIYNANISSYPTYLCFWMFCKFSVDFWVYLETQSCAQRISGVLLKLEFEVKTW